MKRALLFLSLVIILCSCRTKSFHHYPEKVSQMVYATKDSIDASRIDLAKNYAEQSTRLVFPPKERIQIPPIYKPTPDGKSKNRVIIVPPEFNNQEVIVVNSSEYENLKHYQEVAKLLEVDYQKLKKAKEGVDEELRLEKFRIDQIERDLKDARSLVKDQVGSIWKRNCIILGLVSFIVVYFYLKLKKIVTFLI